MDVNERLKVLACIDNVAGYEVLKYLVGKECVDVVGVILHPENNAIFHEEIINLCDSNGIQTISIHTARDKFDSLIKPLNPDYIISIYFDYILDNRFIDLPNMDSINLHPGYLPYNKGFYYYAWAVLDGTPAGVSIHRIVSEVDAGPVISQKKVKVEVFDTGDVIYQKHMDASIQLFKATWPCLENNTYKIFSQSHIGTRKKIVETNDVVNIDPYKKYVAKDLIDTLRVFCFSGKGGCTIELDGKKYNIDIALSEVSNSTNEIMGKKDNFQIKEVSSS